MTTNKHIFNKGRNGFDIPTNYFDDLEQQVQSRVSETGSLPVQKNVLSWVLSGVVAATIITVAFIAFDTTSKNNVVVQQEPELSEELIEYFDIDYYDLTSELAEGDLTVEETNLLDETISDEVIADYLEREGVSDYDIYAYYYQD
tara:strand:- start:4187 stop:4621 length:435 start_codon:yes stop_codon:yes gene_type:complete